MTSVLKSYKRVSLIGALPFLALFIYVGIRIVTGGHATGCTQTLSAGANVGTAMSNASPGSTICLNAGTYTSPSLSHGGVSGSPITLTSTDPNNPATLVGRFVTNGGASYLNINNLKFKWQAGLTEDVVVLGTPHENFTYNDVDGINQSICINGVSYGGSTVSYSLIDHNTVHDCTNDNNPGNNPNQTQGIYMYGGPGDVITNNWCWHVSARCFQIRGEQGSVWHNNVSDDSGQGTVFGDSTSDSNNNFYNNIIGTVVGNAINGPKSAFEYNSGGTGNNYHDNCEPLPEQFSTVAHSNNTVVAVQYVDAANHNYNLSSASVNDPCRAYVVQGGNPGPGGGGGSGSVTPPTVSVATPASGATLSGTTVVTANASESGGSIANVQLKLDGSNLGSPITTSPYTYSWDTTKVANGSHTLSAVATDPSGNTATATAVTVTVNNVASFSCSGSTSLICEDFSSSAAASDFSTTGGTWTVGNGQYTLSSPVAGSNSAANMYNVALANKALSGDFTMTFDGDVTGTSAYDDFGAVFDYQDANNYYFADYNATNTTGTDGIFKVANGVQTELGAFPNIIAPNTVYTTKITKQGSTINVYRNNVLVGTASDTTFSSGKIGIGSRNDPATFDNLVVTGTGSVGDQTPPSQPTGLTATAASSSQINLAWNASIDNVGVAGYRVYRSTGSAAPSLLATVNTTSYGDTGLTAGSTYNYYVVAIDAAGNQSTPSATVSATTPNAATTATVQGVVTSATNGNALSGAHVYTGSRATASGTESTYTNSSGQYVLVNILTNGAHNYYFQASGYKNKSYSLSFQAGLNTFNAQLSPH